MVESSTSLKDIPLELVERIVHYLPPQACAILVRTCKGLSVPSFWRHLYHSVCLQDVDQLDQFLNTILATSLGQYVQQITLSPSLAQQPENMTVLQLNCPNIMAVQLTLEPCDPYPKYNCDLTRWHHLVLASDDLYCNMNDIIESMGSQLLHLSIKTPLSTTITLPCLTTLVYQVEDSLDLDTLNHINQSCPALQTLSLRYLDMPWNGHDWIDQNWTPNQSLVCLEIHHLYMADPTWYRLFGQLYPALHSFILHSLASCSRTTLTRRIYARLDDNDDDDDGDDTSSLHYRHHYTWETTQHAIQELSCGFTQLNRLHIYTIGATPLDTYDMDWLDGLHSLDEVRFDWYSRRRFQIAAYQALERQCDPKWDHLHRLIQSCPEATRWHVFLKNDPISLQTDFFQALASRLVSLSLYTTYENDVTISIPSLLTMLPHLRALALNLVYGKNESLSPIEHHIPRHNNDPPHGLTDFIYLGKLTRSRLIRYIHARCPRLTVLHLDARQTYKHLCLDLSGRTLSRLDLGSTVTFGKDVRYVMVRELVRERSYGFGKGAWHRVLQPISRPHLTIICDTVLECVYKPQPPTLSIIKSSFY